MDGWYSIKELAVILKVGRCTISNLIKTGKLKAVNVGGEIRKTWKIHETALHQFMAESYTQIEPKKLYSVNDIPKDSIDCLKKEINSKVEIDDNGCWIWLKCKGMEKYGYHPILIDGKKHFFSSHRISYFLWKGKIDQSILHKCHVKACCNPEHLYQGNDKQNVIDRYEREKGINHLEERKDRY